MKENLHPESKDIKITCACGSVMASASTLGEDLTVDLCSMCHPFFTGKKKFVDSAGKVEKFQKKYGDVLKNRKKKETSQH
jgi:large subunit ribosomal protein L31